MMQARSKLTAFLSASLCAIGIAFYALPFSIVSAMAAESSDEAGLPQLNTDLFPAQLFWLAVSFAILYMLMAGVALPGVKRTQDNRKHVIASELASASAANDAARGIALQYEKALADARAKAQATVGEIAAQAAKESASQQARQQQDLSKRLQDAEASIRSVRDAALKDVQGVASELAQGIIENVAGSRVKA